MRSFAVLSVIALMNATPGLADGPRKSTRIPSLLNLPAINGINPSLAEGFWEKWHLVTSRYRKDNNQTRIIYANDIAWKAMVKRLPKYPDGAMLAKAIFVSEEDPVFPTSVVPRSFQSVELMKKDHSAYPDTEGWGFAIYWAGAKHDHSEFQPFPADVKGQAVSMKSCWACHSIVKDRDFVFAVPAFLQWFRTDPSVDAHSLQNKFIDASLPEISPFGQKVIRFYKADSFKKFKVFTIPHMLTGERIAVASLALFTQSSGIPHLFMGEDPPTFLLTIPKEGKDKSSDCARFVSSQENKPDSVVIGEVCGTVTTDDHVEKLFIEGKFSQ